MHEQVITSGQMIHAVGGDAAKIKHKNKRGVHVGEVEHLEEAHFIKIKNREEKSVVEHWFPLSWIEGIDEEVVYVSKTPEEFRAELLTEAPLHPPGHPLGSQQQNPQHNQRTSA